MKTLCIIIFTSFLSIAVAEDSTQRAFPGASAKELERKSARVTKSTKAYRKAKDACLKNSEELKGKKLTDCIVEYQKEAK